MASIYKNAEDLPDGTGVNLLGLDADDNAVLVQGVDELIAASDAAVSAAATAATQAGISTTQAGLADAARVLAEAARDAAFGDANIYADTAAGLADTAEGEQFAVIVGDESVRYQHDAGPVATEVARYPTSAMLRLKQTIGRAVTPITGTTSGACTIVFADAITLPVARLSDVALYSAGPGTLAFHRFVTTDDNFVTVGTPLYLDVVSGLNELTDEDFELWPVYAGERIGVTTLGGTLVYTTATADGSGFYLSASPAWAFTDASVATNLRFQIGLTFLAGDLSQVEDRETRLEAARLTEGVQRIGRAGVPADGSNASAGTYVFGVAVAKSGLLSLVDLYCRTAGSLYIRRFTLEGSVFTKIGDDLVLSMSAGRNTWTEDDLQEFNVNAGEYIGFYASSAIAFTTTFAYSSPGGWYYSAGDVQSFTDASAATPRLEIAFEVASGVVPELQAKVANLGTTLRFDDSIADASITAQDGFDLTCSVAFDRNGSRAVLTNSQTIAAATSTNKRYDIWYYDTDAGTFGVASGTERATDPTVGIPTLAINQMPLFLVRATASAAVVTPLWNVYDHEVRTIAAQMEAERRRSRRLLPKTIGKIRRGDPLRILGFGDSITALIGGSGNGSVSAPNGVYRDAAAAASGAYQYLRTGYGADIVDALPLYTAVQLGRADDSAGAIHTRVGWNWELVAALERIGYVLGTDLWYDNLGMNGYATSHAISGGSPTTWLNTATGSGADIVVICLGMNELSSTTTGANMEFIIDEFLDAGIEVLVLGTPVVERRTSRLIRAAAYAKDVAHISLTPLYDPRYVQAMGISSADLYASDRNVHPGLEEYRASGRELVKTLMG